MSGYVRIHRSLIGHPAFRNDAEAMAFAWMVIRAAWKPTRVRYKERAINLARGQLSVSQRDMAAALDRDKAWIERLWKRLKGEAMIEVASEAGVAVITICNYEHYQAESKTREAVDEARHEAGARQGQGTEQEREIREEVMKEDTDASHQRRRAASQPVAEAVAMWNTVAATKGWSQVSKITPDRRTKLAARLREDGGIEAWRGALARAASSKYLATAPPWFGFDFIIKPTNFAKLIEGKYDNERGSPAQQSSGLAAISARRSARFGAGQPQFPGDDLRLLTGPAAGIG